MSPHDSALITQLIAEIQQMRGELVVIRTKLFGDDDKENVQGRIPRLEAQVAVHARKLRRWEPIHLLLRGAWLLIVAASGYLLNHFLELKGH